MEEDFDYEAKDMVNAFDMDEFLKIEDDLDRVNGAFLLITDSQGILSYTKDYGKGYHYESISNALCEIKGKEKDMEWIPILYSESMNENIMARLINEPGMNYFIFEIGSLKSITPNQLQLFEKFMNQYNEQIKKFSEEVETPVVLMEIKKEEIACADLTLVHEYLKTIVDWDKKNEEDVQILGNILLDTNNYERKQRYV